METQQRQQVLDGYYTRSINDGVELCLVNSNNTDAAIEVRQYVLRRAAHQAEMLTLREDSKKYVGLVGDLGITAHNDRGATFLLVASEKGLTFRSHTIVGGSFDDVHYMVSSEHQVQRLIAALDEKRKTHNAEVERVEREQRQRDELEREFVKNKLQIERELLRARNSLRETRLQLDFVQKSAAEAESMTMLLLNKLDRAFQKRLSALEFYSEPQARWWWRFSRAARAHAERVALRHKCALAEPGEAKGEYERNLSQIKRYADEIAKLSLKNNEDSEKVGQLTGRLAELRPPDGLTANRERELARDLSYYSY